MTIKFGVIGLGNRGSKFALSSLITNKNIEVIMVADSSRNHFELFEDKGIQVTTNYQELLENPEVEAVFIATPDGTHGEIVLKAIQHQKHILVEKPLEITNEKVTTLEKALEGYPKVFMVGYVLRYAPLYSKVKELVSSGLIGEVFLANGMDHIDYGGYAFFHDWHRKKENSQSLLLQKSTHSLDIINWLIDSEPIQVSGLGGLEVFGEPGVIKKFGAPLKEPRFCHSCPIEQECEESLLNIKKYKGKEWQVDWPDQCVFDKEIDVQDHQALLIQYANRAKVTYSICHFSAYYRREFQLFGTKGELYFDDERNVIIVHDRLKNEVMRYEFTEYLNHSGGDDEMVYEFIKCIEGEGIPRSNIKSSASVTRLVIASQEAIDQNKICRIR